jgi:hypothetical protein
VPRARHRQGGWPLRRRRSPRWPAQEAGPVATVRAGCFDLVIGAPAEHRLGVVRRIPAFDGMLAALVQQQPRVLTGPVPAAPYQDQAAAELVTMHLGMQFAGRDRRCRIAGSVRLPCVTVPDDHVTAAILSRRDDVLKIQVLDGVILDVHGSPLHRGVEGRSFRTAQLTSTRPISNRTS